MSDQSLKIAEQNQLCGQTSCEKNLHGERGPGEEDESAVFRGATIFKEEWVTHLNDIPDIRFVIIIGTHCLISRL